MALYDETLDAFAEEQRAHTAELMELTRSEQPADTVLDDDLLRLIFTCCHPSLAPASQIMLALRTLCGLSPAQIGAVLLTTETAASKRLTRARQKIAAAHIPYRVPSADELPARIDAVLAVLHLLFTTGHTAPAGEELVRREMCAAYQLDPPLEVDVGIGQDWLDAK